jgi:hypothetical protein
LRTGRFYWLAIAVCCMTALISALLPERGLAADLDVLTRTLHHPLRISVSTDWIVTNEINPAVSNFSPTQMQRAYGINQLGGTGAGKTIAIVVAYGDASIVSDLHAFDFQFGLPDPVLTCYPSASVGTNAGWALETALDVEWAHAMAPGADILLVVAPSASLGDLLAAVDYATEHADIISMSWGGGEFSSEANYDFHFNHPGKIYLAATGDYGSGTDYKWPAVSPYVIGVGGTTLTANPDGSYTETAWSGSGGGRSLYETRPGFQNGFQNSAYRTVPDVAFNADPVSGVMVYYQGGWYPGAVGGTSLSAPCWAGLLALGSGLNLSSLYAKAASDYTLNFRDITSGSNGGYSAGTGYDMVTGLGSPKAQNLIPGPISAMALTPAAQTVAAGNASGIFTLQFLDSYRNPAAVLDNTTVNLSTTSVSGNFSLNTTAWLSTTSANVTAGTSSVNFYYRDTLAGKPTLTAVSGNFTAAAAVTVNPGVESKLMWGTQPPATAVTGYVWNSFTVKITDQFGNQTANADPIRVLPLTGSLGGTVTRNATAGIAAFNDIFSSTASQLTLTAVAVTGNLTATPPSNPIVVFDAVPAPASGGGGGGASTANTPPPPTPKAVAITGMTGSAELNLDVFGRAQTAVQLKSDDGNVIFDIARNTVLCDANGAPVKSLSVAILTGPTPPPPQKTILIAYEFGPEGAVFLPSITLRIPLDSQKLPEGTVPGSVSLACWDGKRWAEVESQIENGILTASLSHFSQWALIGTVIPPAKFALSDIKLSSDKVNVGDMVSIQATVSNSGGASGKYTAALRINGEMTESQEVALEAGGSKSITFGIVKNSPGTYTADINGKNARFTVTAPPPAVTESPLEKTPAVLAPAAAPVTPEAAPTLPVPTTPAPVNAATVMWPIIFGLAAAIAILIGVIMVIRRPRGKRE